MRLIGWHLSAIRTSDLSRENPWFGFAVCPRCYAMVPNDGPVERLVNREVLMHENWHADTDYPRPEQPTDPTTPSLDG